MLHIKLKGIKNAATWSQIFCLQTPPPHTHTPSTTLGYGIKRSKFNFFSTWPCCVSNLRESRLQQHGSKYFARRHPHPRPVLGVWSNVKIQLFQNMVMLHIKKGSQMQQHGSKYFTCRPPTPTPP